MQNFIRNKHFEYQSLILNPLFLNLNLVVALFLFLVDSVYIKVSDPRTKKLIVL